MPKTNLDIYHEAFFDNYKTPHVLGLNKVERDKLIFALDAALAVFLVRECDQAKNVPLESLKAVAKRAALLSVEDNARFVDVVLAQARPSKADEK